MAEHTALEGCGEEEFLVKHLQYAIGVGHYAAGYLKKEHLHVALHMAPANGLLLEFGVANGITANWLMGFDEFKTKRLAYHGFDSFKGLPTAFSAAYPAGTFARPTPPPLPASAKLHVGWFQDTLPGFLAANPTPISFVHNDQDLYGPTKYVQGTLACTCRFQKGTIVAFDEVSLRGESSRSGYSRLERVVLHVSLGILIVCELHYTMCGWVDGWIDASMRIAMQAGGLV